MGAGWAASTLVREMFLACSSTLDFASTMEDVPAVVDLKRTKRTFFDVTDRCIIFGGERKEEREKREDGEWLSYREGERGRLGVQRMVGHVRTAEGSGDRRELGVFCSSNSGWTNLTGFSHGELWAARQFVEPEPSGHLAKVNPAHQSKAIRESFSWFNEQ